MKTVDTNEQLKEYGNELRNITEVLELFMHNLDSLSMIKDVWFFNRLANQFHNTQFTTIQTLIRKIDTTIEGIQDIAEMDVNSPSRDEIIGHFLQSYDRDMDFTNSFDDALKAKGKLVSELHEELQRKIGFEAFNRLDTAQTDLGDDREQERYISGFFEGLSYAKAGKFTKVEEG